MDLTLEHLKNGFYDYVHMDVRTQVLKEVIAVLHFIISFRYLFSSLFPFLPSRPLPFAESSSPLFRETSS